MIAAMHLISASDIPAKLLKQSSELSNLIIQTRKCLDGEKTASEASRVSRDLLQYSMDNWPNFYKTDTNDIKQEDTAEFLLRLLTTDKILQKEVETTSTHTIKCSNSECSLREQNFVIKEQIIIINDLKECNEVSLQQIVDQTTYNGKMHKCAKCQSEGRETKKIIQAPDKLLIQVNRATLNGAKIETAIKCSNREVYIWENGSKLRYEVEGVIIHKGTETQNGHYVYNHYIEGEDKWIQVNDKISLYDMREENRNGAVFVLKHKRTDKSLYI